jgi:hypothetical protein
MLNSLARAVRSPTAGSLVQVVNPHTEFFATGVKGWDGDAWLADFTDKTLMVNRAIEERLVSSDEFYSSIARPNLLKCSRNPKDGFMARALRYSANRVCSRNEMPARIFSAC